jgi:CTP synthase
VHSEEVYAKNVAEKLGDVDGILVAPGFGSRGIDGKIEAIKFARENNIPFVGICLGMQIATIEFARNVLGLTEAHSTEMKEYTQHPVICLMAEQKSIVNKGGTMRLGSYPCKLVKGSKAAKAYGKEIVEERHRHRFEFNNDYMAQFEKAGFKAIFWCFRLMNEFNPFGWQKVIRLNFQMPDVVVKTQNPLHIALQLILR